MKNDNLYWLWLQAVLGYSSEFIHTVLREYGTAEKFYRAPDPEKMKRCGLRSIHKKRMNDYRPEDFADVIKECENTGIKIYNINDDRYPERLYNIGNPPTVIFVSGELPRIDDEPAITIVGPRAKKLSLYGRRAAYSIARRLARAGCLVVSGGATGADSYAHYGAMSAGGKTVAVLGCGINNNYLKVNAALRKEISQNGCLISEYPPQMSASRGSFPVRNRILSALSVCTLVVEGGTGSGAIITANHAIEQGRDVFAIPGEPSNECYKGTNQLIDDGVRPLLSVKNVLDQYYPLFPDKIDIDKAYAKEDRPHYPKFKYSYESDLSEVIQPQTAGKHVKRQPDGEMFSENAAKIYELLGTEPEYVDSLIVKTGLSPGDVISAVTELELYGYVSSVGGGRIQTV